MSYPVHKNDHQNHAISWSFSRSDCNGKEKDYESGFHYYGARYYWSELLTGWLSVDPMADKYPTLNPYNYCAWNPIVLTDPNGDSIINAYAKYKDVSQIVQNLIGSMKGATRSERRKIQQKIDNFQYKNEKYHKVQGAIDAFRKRNPEEYNILNNKLVSHGEKVNIWVWASDDFVSPDGAAGKTSSSMLHDTETKKIVGVSAINITLYKHAFLNGNNGLSTLANEFGDAIFSIACPQKQFDGFQAIQRNRDYYWKESSSRFSFAYERYIMNPEQNKKPNPYDF